MKQEQQASTINAQDLTAYHARFAEDEYIGSYTPTEPVVLPEKVIFVEVIESMNKYTYSTKLYDFLYSNKDITVIKHDTHVTHVESSVVQYTSIILFTI